jgi:hypothetical protein
MGFHQDRQLSHMNHRIIMGAVHHIILDRRIISGAVRHIILDGLQCAILAVDGVRRCQREGHEERVLKTFQWDHWVLDRGPICRCILIGMKVRQGGRSCMNETSAQRYPSPPRAARGCAMTSSPVATKPAMRFALGSRWSQTTCCA